MAAASASMFSHGKSGGGAEGGAGLPAGPFRPRLWSGRRRRDRLAEAEWKLNCVLKAAQRARKVMMPRCGS